MPVRSPALRGRSTQYVLSGNFTTFGNTFPTSFQGVEMARASGKYARASWPGTVTHSWSFSTWIYMTATPSAALATVFDFYDYPSAKGIGVLVDSSRRPTMWVNRGNFFFSYTCTAAIPLNTWTHVAMTDGSGIHPVVYVNGVASTWTGSTRTDQTPVGPTVGNKPFVYLGLIEQDGTSDQRDFTGYLNGVGFWIATLSAGDISTLAANLNVSPNTVGSPSSWMHVS